MSVRRSALSFLVTVAASLAMLVGPGVPHAAADQAPASKKVATAKVPATTSKLTKAQKLRAKANKVIKAAKSRVKKGQYKWGASGPNRFDCSGLMIYSFKKVGIKLPHSSRAQSKKGKKVARKNLKPGDLVFFYSPVSHVALYIGGGKIVHARNTRVDLQIGSLKKYGHYHSARRVIR
ncbi:MAG: C40 family peptidase [Micropruina sp.]|nr:C40 family peptidase [Micropruina sp.]